jgi:hypothetical protein
LVSRRLEKTVVQAGRFDWIIEAADNPYSVLSFEARR